MNTINLTIDNKKINVPEGTNLVDAAKTADIDIPTLKDTDEDWDFSEETFTLLFRRYAVDGKSNTQSPVMDRAYELIWKQHDAKGISVAAKFLKGLGAQRKSRS